MSSYYNEIEPTAILWLQAAMDAGVIANGVIDTQPIQEIKADDLRGFTQHHFFAGIGGWSIALRLAGWADEKPVWTGSCPCQPFSTAGRQKGKQDERHLWPHWFRLIRELKPTTIFGEQVGSAVTHGWLDEVADDLEKEDYAVGAAVLPACSVSAPHKRDRIWFVGNSDHHGQSASTKPSSNGASILNEQKRQDCTIKSKRAGISVHVAHTNSKRQQGQGQLQQSVSAAQDCIRKTNRTDHFSEISWINCPDGKQRAIKPNVCLLVDGIPAKLRKAALHGYGNAIVPQVAAEFITAAIEAMP